MRIDCEGEYQIAAPDMAKNSMASLLAERKAIDKELTACEGFHPGNLRLLHFAWVNAEIARRG